ncbi:MAG: DevR family CRISPR-associated autoregulator [Candidatus Omnitrophota bacterium]
MKLHSLSISGLITINMHSLNNEGAEGNTTMTRMVEIVDAEGKNHTVNAISGDMFKHIQAEHLFMDAKTNGLPLCEGCKNFDANRIRSDEAYGKEILSMKEFKKAEETNKIDSFVLDKILTKCVIDDCEGIMITGWGGSKSLSRKSSVEFGWIIGLPDITRTESYFHAKYVREGKGKGSGSEENLGQNIFHQPASSGQYAVVVNLDLYKVSRNDITLEYVSGVKRDERIKALLKSVLNTFIKPAGAKRNTQLPHILNFKGVIATSLSTLPAPVMSSLNPDYLEQIKKIAENLNKLASNTIKTNEFTDIAAFSEKMTEIINSVQPYENKNGGR